MAKLTLLDARTLLGWTQARLASEAGIKTTAVSDIESGRTTNPGYSTVARLIRALQGAGLQGLKTEDIFSIDDEVKDEARAS